MKRLPMTIRMAAVLCFVGTGLTVIAQAAEASCADPGPYQVTIYSDWYYGGTQCNVLGVGSYPNPASMGMTDNWMSSLKVGSGVRAILFQNSNYSGTEATYIFNAPDMLSMNDQTSSMIVQYDYGEPLYRNSSWTFNETWTENAQGIANADGYATYITQTGTMWRISWGYGFSGINCSSAGVTCVSVANDIPTALKNAGYTHFGDPDYYSGWVLVPLEDKTAPYGPPVLLVYNGTTTPMTFAGWDYFPNQATNAGWVSVNPATGRLWTSDATINNTSGNRLWSYTMNWGSLCTAGPPSCDFLTGGTYKNLYQRNGSTAVNLVTLQGGDFTADGSELFLSNSSVSGDGFGVRLFSASSGALRVRSWRYQWYGHFMLDIVDATDEEVEGLDVRNSTTMDVIVTDWEPTNDHVFWKQFLTAN